MKATYAACGWVFANNTSCSMSLHHLDIFSLRRIYGIHYFRWLLLDVFFLCRWCWCWFPERFQLPAVTKHHFFMISHNFSLFTRYPNRAPCSIMPSHHFLRFWRVPAPVASSASQTWLMLGASMWIEHKMTKYQWIGKNALRHLFS